MRSAHIQEVYANLVAQKHHDDQERYMAGMDYARRVLLTDPARLSNGGMINPRVTSRG